MRIEAKSTGPPKRAPAVCTDSARKEAGFSLIEVMVSTGLLTFMVVALYAAFSFGFSSIKLAQEDVRADQILVQKLETLRVYDWSKITNGYIPTNITTAFSASGGVDYDVRFAIGPAPLTASYSNTLRQVTVELSWDSAGVTRSRSITTLVSQNGLQTYKP